MATLFLKYRPQTFSDLVGQELIIRTLQNALKNEKPSHAYLFSGSRGTGKTSTARIFAKGLNCLHLNDGLPCGECDICVSTANGSLVDVIEIDAASNRGIDEIRAIREKVNFTPNIAKRKIYIIDEVHMLTKEAFNALLKTLEEPPEHAFFCLATTEMHKIPETIISRCQTFIFQRFPLEQLADRLEHIVKNEGFQAERIALELIAKKAEGGMRDAISLLEQMADETDANITEQSVRESLGISPTEVLENLWESISENNSSKAMTIIHNINKRGGDFRSFGHDFLTFLRQKLHDHLDNGEILQKVLQSIEEFQIAIARLKTSPIIELPFEIAVVNLTANLPQIEIRTVAKPQEIKKNESPKITPKEEIKEAKIEPKTKPQDNAGFVFTKPLPQEAPNTPAEEKIPNQKPTPNIEINSDLNVNNLKLQMASIAEKAGIPIFVKKSFLTMEPEINRDNIIFVADSSFHQDKLNDDKSKNAIKKVLNEMFGKDIKLEFICQPKRNNSHPQTKPDEIATVDDLLDF